MQMTVPYIQYLAYLWQKTNKVLEFILTELLFTLLFVILRSQMTMLILMAAISLVMSFTARVLSQNLMFPIFLHRVFVHIQKIVTK